MTLEEKHCVPCEGIGQALNRQQADGLMSKIPGWVMSSDSKSISRSLRMKNFMSAVRLINNVADIAEAENHHPDVHLTSYRNLLIELSTHALHGLTENDFILAAKINTLSLALKAQP